MQNLNFDNGVKEIMVNGNPNAIIRICTNDFSLPVRFQKMHDEVSVLLGSIGHDPAAIAEADKEIRMKMNELLGGDVSDALFGTTNCLSLSNGSPIVVNCLMALMPIVREAVESETAQAKQKIKEYAAQAKQLPQA